MIEVEGLSTEWKEVNVIAGFCKIHVKLGFILYCGLCSFSQNYILTVNINYLHFKNEFGDLSNITLQLNLINMYKK